jgi:MFS family permease
MNRNVFAFGLTSLLSDFCHEMATAVLPQFLQSIGASAAALGFIEGAADALSSFVKLGAGFQSDKTGRRKGWAVLGYLLTALAKALFAFAVAWPLILVGRVIGWLGRGIRGPLRDAMLAESVDSQDRGKAFGFHRASDTLGAILGPLAAYGLLAWLGRHPDMLSFFTDLFPFFSDLPGTSFRVIFLLTLFPGLLSVLTLAILVREKHRTANGDLSFWGALKSLPKNYRSFLTAVGCFGLADFAPTLMILHASVTLSPLIGPMEAAKLAALLYILRNVAYAAASFPIGAASTHFSRGGYLAFGYGIAVVTFLGLAFSRPSFAWFAVCFILSGVFIAWEDTMEAVAVRDYVGDEVAGSAYGVLGVVNGIGDFFSSLMVGFLWTAMGAFWGFLYAAVVGGIGAWMMFRISRTPSREAKTP